MARKIKPAAAAPDLSRYFSDRSTSAMEGAAEAIKGYRAGANSRQSARVVAEDMDELDRKLRQGETDDYVGTKFLGET